MFLHHDAKVKWNSQCFTWRAAFTRAIEIKQAIHEIIDY